MVPQPVEGIPCQPVLETDHPESEIGIVGMRALRPRAWKPFATDCRILACGDAHRLGHEVGSNPLQDTHQGFVRFQDTKFIRCKAVCSPKFCRSLRERNERCQPVHEACVRGSLSDQIHEIRFQVTPNPVCKICEIVGVVQTLGQIGTVFIRLALTHSRGQPSEHLLRRVKLQLLEEFYHTLVTGFQLSVSEKLFRATQRAIRGFRTPTDKGEKDPDLAVILKVKASPIQDPDHQVEAGCLHAPVRVGRCRVVKLGQGGTCHEKATPGGRRNGPAGVGNKRIQHAPIRLGISLGLRMICHV